MTTNDLDPGSLALGDGLMTTRDEQSQELARMHYEVETGLTHVYRITGASAAEAGRAKPVKLLEVNENTVPSGIMPIWFGPAPEIGLTHSSVILEVTPEEFQLIQDRQLKLPDGWEIGELIPKPSEDSR